MRGLAILLVVIYHYFGLTVSVVPGTWQWYAMAPIRMFWSGVDLFFVLSGFLIAGILIDSKASGSVFRTFYFRRAFRILPIYCIWFFLLLLGISATSRESSEPQRLLFNFGVPLMAYVGFVQNWFMSDLRTLGSHWMAVTWSLAVEEQFYLMLPGLVRGTRRCGLMAVALAAIGAAPGVRLYLTVHGNEYYGPYMLLPSRADALGAGVVIAILCRDQKAWAWLTEHRRGLITGLVFLGLGVAWLMSPNKILYTFGLTWLAAFYAMLVLLAIVEPGRFVRGVFSSRLLTWLGTVAYGVYLFHQGVNALLHLWLFDRQPRVDGVAALGATLLAIVLTGLLAAGAWRWVEKPLIEHSHRAWRY